MITTTTHATHSPHHQQARTCDELGMCQGRAIPCLNCTRADAPAWDTNEVTCTPFELIWYWAMVLVLLAFSVATVAGLAGYWVGWL